MKLSFFLSSEQQDFVTMVELEFLKLARLLTLVTLAPLAKFTLNSSVILAPGFQNSHRVDSGHFTVILTPFGRLFVVK